MTQLIVLIPVDYTNAKQVAYSLRNLGFKAHKDLVDRLKNDLECEEEDKEDIEEPQIYTIDEFTDEINDQLIDELGAYFMTYATINE